MPRRPPRSLDKRLHLLDAAEIAARYDRPQFTDEERAYCFHADPSEVAHMQTFTDGAVQAVFVLQLGYFKARQRFFSLELAEVRTDRSSSWGMRASR